MLHCGWRGLAAGIVDRGVEEVGAHGRGDRARDRALLLRGRRRGAGGVRGARRGRRRRADARPARGRAAPARARRGRARSRPAASARAASPSSSSPTAASGAHRAPGGPRLESMAEPIRGIDPERRPRATSSGSASAAGPRSRSSRRPSTCRRGDGSAWPRPGSSWSARTASRTWRRSASAGATRFTWDFIGNLQSRKVKRILPLVRLIHSVATRLGARAARAPRRRRRPRSWSRSTSPARRARAGSSPSSSASSSRAARCGSAG